MSCGLFSYFLSFYSYNRGWFYHKDLRLWFMRVPNMEPLVKTNAYERGSYLAFDPNTWDTSIKVFTRISFFRTFAKLNLNSNPYVAILQENCVIHYELIEKRPALHHQ